LLDATDELMYKRGYETVSVADLCATAEARKDSFLGDRRSNNLALAKLDRA